MPGPRRDAGGKDLDHYSRLLARTLERAVQVRGNETELREDADSVIREAVSDLFGLQDFQQTAERRPRRGSRQSYDKAYGGVVVEWEWAMENARRRQGARQAVEYLCQMRAEVGFEEAFTAVVSDGAQWGFLVVDPCGQQDLFGTVPSDPVALFEWHPNSTAACRRFLELVGSHAASPVTASGLANAFGPGSTGAQQVVGRLLEALAGRSDGDRVDTLYREWRRVLDVVYGDLDQVRGEFAEAVSTSFGLQLRRSVGESLFVLHTYFALVARLIALEVLAVSTDDRYAQPTEWEALEDDAFIERLSELDRGELPASLDVQNLFEADVFSWYLDAARGNVDLLNGIRSILGTMRGFAFPRMAFGSNPAGDALRDLYQVLVPRPLRRALGEFLTPAWLAEGCIERVVHLDPTLREGRVLDPTCGTGTFLLPLLRDRLQRLRASRGSHIGAEDVQEVLDTIGGFDINPVAIIAARVNVVVALGELATVGPITLPLWRADSILVPDAPPRQGSWDEGSLAGHNWREVITSLPLPFAIPASLAHADRMAALRRILEMTMEEEDAERGLRLFRTLMERDFGPQSNSDLRLTAAEWEDAVEVAGQLQDRIRVLRDEGRNGVWARIIENAFAPLFVEPFDWVIGNPPWVTWTRLPEAWRRRAEPVWRKYGLWRAPLEPGERRSSLASTDLAALVFATALHRYTNDQGVVALLTPDSLLTGDPGGRAFRKYRLVDEADVGTEGHVDIPFKVLHVDDWSPLNPFAPDASNRPVFIVARRGLTQEFPIPQTKWSRAVPGVRLADSWSVVKMQTRASHGSTSPVNRQVSFSALSFQSAEGPRLIEGGENPYSFGKGLDTRGANGVFFVEILHSNRREGRVLIQNDPAAGRTPGVRETRGWVEAELVYPLLRGRDVQTWSAVPSGYILAPYEPDDLARLLSEERWAEFPEAHRWLRRHRPILSARRPPPTRSWNLNGNDWCRLDGPLNYMDEAHIVVVRELQQRPAAAVMSARFDDTLGRATAPLIDHKLMFCAVRSADEARFLTAIINSGPIQDLLASYGNQIAMSPQTLRRLPIPQFDETDSGHQAIATAVSRVIEANESPVELAEAVLSLLMASDDGATQT